METGSARALGAPPHETVNTLAERGIGFRSLTEGIDTTTPAGKLVFHIFASLAANGRSSVNAPTPDSLPPAPEGVPADGGRR